MKKEKPEIGDIVWSNSPNCFNHELGGEKGFFGELQQIDIMYKVSVDKKRNPDYMGSYVWCRNARKATSQEIAQEFVKNSQEISHFEVIKAFPGVKVGTILKHQNDVDDCEPDNPDVGETYFYCREIETFYDTKELDCEFFKPIYKVKYELPKINSYSGKLEEDYLVYGCARIYIPYIKCLTGIAQNKGNGQNREIKSFKLDSGVEITMEQVKQICEFLDNQ